MKARTFLVFLVSALSLLGFLAGCGSDDDNGGGGDDGGLTLALDDGDWILTTTVEQAGDASLCVGLGDSTFVDTILVCGGLDPAGELDQFGDIDVTCEFTEDGSDFTFQCAAGFPAGGGCTQVLAVTGEGTYTARSYTINAVYTISVRPADPCEEIYAPPCTLYTETRGTWAIGDTASVCPDSGSKGVPAGALLSRTLRTAFGIGD